MPLVFHSDLVVFVSSLKEDKIPC